MYGSINEAHEAILRKCVAGRTVVDFGSGDGERAEKLREFGARAVITIDQQSDAARQNGREVDIVRPFDKVAPADGDVAHVAWPINHRLPGLVELLGHFQAIIYVGSNTSMNACGSPELGQFLRRRRVLAYSPARSNTMIVYGGPCPIRRRVTHEERGMIDWMHPYGFSDTHKRVRLPRGQNKQSVTNHKTGGARPWKAPVVQEYIPDRYELGSY